MFSNIGWGEIFFILIIGLIVIGPERLPGAARTAGLWVGRLKRSFNAIKQEVEREIGADEIRRQLHNEHILSLEQEARKIFTPVQQEPTPVEHVGEQTIHAPAAPAVTAPTPAPAAAAAPPAPVQAATETSVEHVSPTAAPITPAPHDTTLPPRAP